MHQLSSTHLIGMGLMGLPLIVLTTLWIEGTARPLNTTATPIPAPTWGRKIKQLGGGSENDADDGYEPEVEDDFLSLRHIHTNVYVFVANPNHNTVSRINVDDLSVPDNGVGGHIGRRNNRELPMAVTFNKGSDSISIINSSTLEVTEIEVRDNFNQMKMSPDGNWVIYYRRRCRRRQWSGWRSVH